MDQDYPENHRIASLICAGINPNPEQPDPAVEKALKERKTFMDALERKYNNLRALERKLVFENRKPLKNEQYRRLAKIVMDDVAKARERGWMRPAADPSSN